jgi:hypothetical protein
MHMGREGSICVGGEASDAPMSPSLAPPFSTHTALPPLGGEGVGALVCVEVLELKSALRGGQHAAGGRRWSLSHAPPHALRFSKHNFLSGAFHGSRFIPWLGRPVAVPPGGSTAGLGASTRPSTPISAFSRMARELAWCDERCVAAILCLKCGR